MGSKLENFARGQRTRLRKEIEAIRAGEMSITMRGEDISAARLEAAEAELEHVSVAIASATNA